MPILELKLAISKSAKKNFLINEKKKKKLIIIIN